MVPEDKKYTELTTLYHASSHFRSIKQDCSTHADFGEANQTKFEWQVLIFLGVSLFHFLILWQRHNIVGFCKRAA